MFERMREMWNQRSNREQLYSTSEYWDLKAKTQSGKAVSMWPNNALNELYERETQAELGRRLGDIKGLRILDLGCGAGRISRWFAARGGEVTGIDFSPAALQIAESEAAMPNLRYRLGSIFELADEDTFDVVFAWSVITCACQREDQVLDVLKRIRRALRPQGRLLLIEPVHHGFLHRVLDMDIKPFLALVRAAGFAVRDTEPMHFWPARLLLSYVQWPRWVTRPVYWLGQACMRMPGLARLGEYWVILASPAEPGSPS